jgi:hypothetical protein
MTQEQQRIAIAKACGWTHIVKENEEWAGRKPGTLATPYLPDYLNDLNTMHEAECTLDGDQWDIYCTILESMDGPAISAVAWRRAEAFLKTLGLWR